MTNVNALTPARFSAAAAAGLRVFPGKRRSKKPALPWKKYQHEAPTEDEVAGWDVSDFNVCIVTGAPSDIIVLDVDSPEAQDLVDKLNLPTTPTVKTARGRHLYFKRPGYPVRNGVKIGGVKLDVRGDGGYVIGPGSIHPSGVAYDWLVSPDETAFAPFPDQLAALISGQKSKGQGSSPTAANTPKTAPRRAAGLEAFLLCELEEAQAEIAGAANGSR